MLWDIPTKDKIIYLTFDDGPTPAVTNFVLETLDSYSAKATFFCLGIQIKMHGDLAGDIIRRGHQMGNHGYHHLDGWRVSNSQYQKNISAGFEEIHLHNNGSKLFRPPYGHFRPTSNIQNRDMSTVMWSLMAGDFDQNQSKEKCLSRMVSKSKTGDIVVFHDSEKAFEVLRFVLPRYLEYFQSLGYSFHIIPN